MPDPDAPLSETAAAYVHGYVAASNAALALVQADDLAMETVARNRQGAAELAPQASRGRAKAFCA